MNESKLGFKLGHIFMSLVNFVVLLGLLVMLKPDFAGWITISILAFLPEMIWNSKLLRKLDFVMVLSLNVFVLFNLIVAFVLATMLWTSVSGEIAAIFFLIYFGFIVIRGSIVEAGMKNWVIFP